MDTGSYKRSAAPLMLFLILGVTLSGCREMASDLPDEDLNKVHTVTDTDQNTDAEYAVEAPPFTDGIFPCMECHAYQDPNPLRRDLVEFHDDIDEIFNHDSENRWCLDCHDLEQRDSLKLASGARLDFRESYRLCGQCHGDKLRDWKVGVHGKRKGEWNGKKEYLLCVHCHNPHSPKFQKLTPEPAPQRQGENH